MGIKRVLVLETFSLLFDGQFTLFLISYFGITLNKTNRISTIKLYTYKNIDNADKRLTQFKQEM